MKKIQPTYRIFLAVAMLLLLSLFPHHHHEGGAVCVAEEVCETDGRANDEHTAHGAEHQRDSHYCYWQVQHRVTSMQRDAGWTANYHPMLLPLAYIALPPAQVTELFLSGRSRNIVSLYAFSSGRHMKRRGPPLV